MPNSSANINFVRSPKFNFLGITSPEAKFERVLPLPPIVASYSGRSPATEYKRHNESGNSGLHRGPWGQPS
ncbi:hypothetical protein PILCRDRAFT_823663 [Piloderma croceum F 1598]|uniref:Uncharacterized protein n=1 Tax=Piloderma croceum (strain F 1598) TaxID=765440 RepID=A0A0C3F2Z7_PILCF|nr:hypothetical protein PILCRDRAFT_823663 [Piloderma croceum F 1598]